MELSITCTVHRQRHIICIIFCNSIFYGLPLQQTQRLQSLQNSSARLLTFTRKTAHITPVLKSLHWLPVLKRIQFKILMLVHRAIHNMSPEYIIDSILEYNPPRTLRSSSSQLLQVPRTVHSWGDRSFSHAGPTLWNNLPPFLRNIPSYTAFKEQLKSYLFNS